MVYRLHFILLTYYLRISNTNKYTLRFSNTDTKQYQTNQQNLQKSTETSQQRRSRNTWTYNNPTTINTFFICSEELQSGLIQKHTCISSSRINAISIFTSICSIRVMLDCALYRFIKHIICGWFLHSIHITLRYNENIYSSPYAGIQYDDSLKQMILMLLDINVLWITNINLNNSPYTYRMYLQITY